MEPIVIAPPSQRGTHPVRYTARLPKQAIPLARLQADPPSPEANLTIIDRSPSSIASTEEGFVAVVDRQGRLQAPDGAWVWKGSAFWLTSYLHEGRWLFGVHHLRYPLGVESSEPEEVRQAVRVLREDGAEYTGPYVVDIVEKDPWRARVLLERPYLSEPLFVAYPALQDGEIDEAWQEPVHPLPVFSRAASLSELGDERYVQHMTTVPWESVLYVSDRRTLDDRSPLGLRFRLRFDGIQGGSARTVYTPWLMGFVWGAGDAAAPDGWQVLIEDVDRLAALYGSWDVVSASVDVGELLVTQRIGPLPGNEAMTLLLAHRPAGEPLAVRSGGQDLPRSAWTWSPDAPDRIVLHAGVTSAGQLISVVYNTDGATEPFVDFGPSEAPWQTVAQPIVLAGLGHRVGVPTAMELLDETDGRIITDATMAWQGADLVIRCNALPQGSFARLVLHLPAGALPVDLEILGDEAQLGSLRARWTQPFDDVLSSEMFVHELRPHPIHAQVDLTVIDGGKVTYQEPIEVVLETTRRVTPDDFTDSAWVAVRTIEPRTMPIVSSPDAYLVVESRHPYLLVGIRPLDRPQELVVDPDGRPILSYSALDDARHYEVVVCGVGYFREVARRYAVLPLDVGSLRVEAPSASYQSPWYLRVRQGGVARIEQDASGLPVTRYYTLPDLWGSDLIHAVSGELAVILDEQTIAVTQRPLVVQVDRDGKPTNLRVYRGPWELPVEAWDARTGQIRLRATVHPDDVIRVDYVYFAPARPYEGFVEDGRFYPCDLNVLPGHVLSFPVGDQAWLDQSAGHVMLEPIAIWARPAAEAAMIGQMRDPLPLTQASGIATLSRPALTSVRPEVWVQGPSGYEPVQDATAYFVDAQGNPIDPVQPLASHVFWSVPQSLVGEMAQLRYRTTLDSPRLVPGSVRKDVLRHGPPVDGEPMLHLADVVVRPHLLAEHVRVDDLRPQGGGLKEGVDPGRRAVLDVRPLEGDPVVPSGIVLRVREATLAATGVRREEVERAAARHAALGQLPLVVEESGSSRVVLVACAPQVDWVEPVKTTLELSYDIAGTEG